MDFSGLNATILVHIIDCMILCGRFCIVHGCGEERFNVERSRKL